MQLDSGGSKLAPGLLAWLFMSSVQAEGLNFGFKTLVNY